MSWRCTGTSFADFESFFSASFPICFGNEVKGTVDKAGQPYLLDPLRLMVRVETETEKFVALLHDVVEDSQPPQRWGLDELRREGISESALAALEGVTRRESETYEEFIRHSLTHPVTRRVKLADLEDNMDILRLATLTDRDAERLRRYLAAWRGLTGAK